MKKFIVTTTINSPTIATRKFCEFKDWTLIVVGDTKTPHQKYKDLDCIYLSPDDQEILNKELSDIIGWNSIRRRNLEFLFAYQQGADIVATVDDDNIPYDDWGTDLYVGQEIECDFYESEHDVFDPLSVTFRNEVWHRGYPIEYVPITTGLISGLEEKYSLKVSDILYNIDPQKNIALCSNTVFDVKVFEAFMNWVMPLFEYVMELPLCGHFIERALPVFYLIKDIDFEIMLNAVENLALDCTGNQQLPKEKFFKLYDFSTGRKKYNFEHEIRFLNQKTK